MLNAKGMVELGDVTYRIAEVGRGNYQATRVSDNVRMGTFRTFPRLSLKVEDAGEGVLFAVARTAFMQGKTNRFRHGGRESMFGAEAAAAVARHLSHWRSWHNQVSLSMFKGMWRGVFPLLAPSVGAISLANVDMPFAASGMFGEVRVDS
jgi:hypothetical protein